MREIIATGRDIEEIFRSELFSSDEYMVERPDYLSEQLITYIGNKRRLLPFIEGAMRNSIKELAKEEVSFADVFAGSGVVSRMARKWVHTLYVNDIEEYSAYINKVYHRNRSEVSLKSVDDARVEVNRVASERPRSGFITELYSPCDENNITKEDRVFYTRRNAMFIDTARQEIEKLDKSLQPFLLVPLMQRASVHTNTSGVFKGFYKNKEGIGQFGGTMRNALARICEPIEIPLPVLSRFEREVYVSQLEALDFVKSIPPVDVAYFDPPYNQHPYGSNYFMLNLILNYVAPTEISRVSGIPKGWTRSNYNVRGKALESFSELLSWCKSKVLLISYSSEGFIKLSEMLGMLGELGEVTLFDCEYNTFRGCRNLANRSGHVTEFLFKIVR